MNIQNRELSLIYQSLREFIPAEHLTTISKIDKESSRHEDTIITLWGYRGMYLYLNYDAKQLEKEISKSTVTRLRKEILAVLDKADRKIKYRHL